MMAEPLDSIIQAIRNRDYIMSIHYWETVVKEGTRPPPFAIIASIGDNVPEIIEDYPSDPRGASCLVLGLNGQGQQIHTVIGYEYHTIKIISAYHPRADKWIDGRIRR
jgi:hypothetical protein